MAHRRDPRTMKRFDMPKPLLNPKPLKKKPKKEKRNPAWYRFVTRTGI